MSSISKNDFPSEWIMYGLKHCQKCILNLDTSSKGQILWKKLATFLCLLDTSVPTRDTFENYAKELNKLSVNGYIEQKAFVQVNRILFFLI